ncbi:hypothetical protein E2562_018901 [Oryza meyeriana var. granulata]|uniref:DUF834 domain-containing protein n=1 Tax=Oryza meyeriana var. granulata TaxID=110450 RepID=A0A6G1FA22_9ORYZ|nr:hypothetical protein E2562_018901 [Oryza meyeriana var. granulata]
MPAPGWVETTPGDELGGEAGEDAGELHVGEGAGGVALGGVPGEEDDEVGGGGLRQDEATEYEGRVKEEEETEEAGCCSGRRAMRIHGGGRATSAPSSPNGSIATSKIWNTE